MTQQKYESILKKTLAGKYDKELTTNAEFLSKKILYAGSLREMFGIGDETAHEAYYFKCTGTHLLPNVGLRSLCLHTAAKETLNQIVADNFDYTPNDIMITYISLLAVTHMINKVNAYDLVSSGLIRVKVPSAKFLISKTSQQNFMVRAMLGFIEELVTDRRLLTRDAALIFNPLKFGRVQLLDELQYGVHYLLKEKSDQKDYLAYLQNNEDFRGRDHEILAQDTYPTIANENHYQCTSRLPSLFLISCLHFTDPIYTELATPLSIIDAFWFNSAQEDDLVEKINSLSTADFAAWLSAGLYYVNGMDSEKAQKSLENTYRIMISLESRIEPYKMKILRDRSKGDPNINTNADVLNRARAGLKKFVNAPTVDKYDVEQAQMEKNPHTLYAEYCKDKGIETSDEGFTQWMLRS